MSHPDHEARPAAARAPKPAARDASPKLVWPGKGPLASPAAGADAPRLSRLERVLGERAGSAGWTNTLLWADNASGLEALLASHAGQVDLVYIDPPFATGGDRAQSARAARRGPPRAGDEDGPTAYIDRWGKGSLAYLDAMWQRLPLIRALLSERGTLFVHCDWHVVHYLRCMLDEVFGADAFKNEIVWRYRRWPAKSKAFQRMHDTLLWYARSERDLHAWNVRYEPLAKSTLETFGTKRQVADFSTGRRKPSQTDDETLGAPLADVWDIGIIAPIAHERLGYPTQKPEALLERIIACASNPGDLVADLFCGSGTTLAVAERLGRRWLGCDVGRLAIHTTRKRLLSLRWADEEEDGERGCRPFEVVTLGAFERQRWAEQNVSLVHGAAGDPEKAAARRLLEAFGAALLELDERRPSASRQLELYPTAPAEAPPVSGTKNGALVRVGPLSGAPASAHFEAAIADARKLGVRELCLLGWEWDPLACEQGFAAAARAKLALTLVTVPREILDARATSDALAFWPMARVDISVRAAGERSVVLRLDGYSEGSVDGDGAAAAGGQRAKENGAGAATDRRCGALPGQAADWAEAIDGWAVDWDFRGGAFAYGWSSMRTPKAAPALETPPHHYERGGACSVAVKVFDRSGWEAVRCLEVQA